MEIAELLIFSAASYIFHWHLWVWINVPAFIYLRRFSFEKYGWKKCLLVFSVGAFFCTSLQVVLQFAMFTIFPPASYHYTNQFKLKYYIQFFSSNFSIFWLILGVSLIITYYRKYKKRDMDAKMAEKISSVLEGKTTALLNKNGVSENTLNAAKTKDFEKYIKRVSVKTNGKIKFIKAENIYWIEAAGSYIYIHTHDQRHLMRCTLKYLETQLNPEHFIRIHRSQIVNCDKIIELFPRSHGEFIVILNNDTKLKLSRRYRTHFKKSLSSTRL